MPINPFDDALSLVKAAEFLEVTTYQIGHVVITGELRCGVYARGWRGLAIPLLNGKKDVGAWDAAKDGDVYHCSPKGTDIRYTIHACELAQFWYLAHADAYELFTMYRDGIDVRLLEPKDGAALHQEQPDRFPAPEFAMWVEDDSPNRRVTLDDVLFLRRDLEALRPMPKTTDNVGKRAETTYLNIIGGLLRLMLDKLPDDEPKPLYNSQAAIIEALLARYEGRPGIALRTLEQKFSAAKRSLYDN